jgi:hypothetical protein
MVLPAPIVPVRPAPELDVPVPLPDDPAPLVAPPVVAGP